MFATHWDFRLLRNESKAPDDQTVNRLLAAVQLKVLVGTHFHKNSRPSSKVLAHTKPFPYPFLKAKNSLCLKLSQAEFDCKLIDMSDMW